jgi:hypothetical protein
MTSQALSLTLQSFSDRAPKEDFFVCFWDDKDNASEIFCKEIKIFFPGFVEIKIAI